jgi:aminoglycoside phosphotransferase family enzyme/predicted kinase
VNEPGPPPHEPWADHLETHISSVFFAGAYAYKQLKPMTTAFLDYGSIERRGAALADEVALNRRIAPDVYLGCVPITAGDATIDHLMIMRRLPHRRRLSALVGAPDFEDQLRAVARTVAAFHAALEPDDQAAELASVEAERSRWQANLTELRDLVHLGCIDDDEIDTIGHMADSYLSGRATLFAERIAAGLARDGHGDLLAADIFCLDDGPRILDCLAFDPTLRKGDVLADIAFLVMDIERLAGHRPAQRLLRWYQEFSNEHHPASLAHLHIAYRALVRAKVTMLRFAQTDSSDDRLDARNHVAQCLDHLRRARVRLVLVGGGPGTGKSTVAEAIGATLEWPVLSSDELRKEQAGIDATVHALARPDEGLYTRDRTEATYDALVDRAGQLLARGQSVVLDASWSRATHREAARRVAAAGHAHIIEIETHLDPATAKERIVRRLSSPWTVSDATPEIVDHMAALHDPWPEAIGVPTDAPLAETRAAAVRAALALEDDAAALR